MTSPEDRLRQWIPTAENAAGETGHVADLDDALADQRIRLLDDLDRWVADHQWGGRVIAAHLYDHLSRLRRQP